MSQLTCKGGTDLQLFYFSAKPLTTHVSNQSINHSVNP